MGTNDLWAFIDSIGEDDTLFDIGGRSIWSNDETFTLGVDILGWCYEAERIASQKWGHSGGSEQHALSILFNRISHLAGLPIAARFVQDGPERPLVKRGKQVRTADHPLIEGTRAFAEAYGFEWHKAPGEGEAELAMLNFEGAIDAVMSEDNDVFMFGARTTLRKVKKETQSDQERWPIRIFSAEKLQTDLPGSVSLTREALLFVAILAGADYDSNGLPGCGLKTAALLSSSIGDHAQALFDMATTYQYDPPKLQQELVAWRLNLADELEKNTFRTLPNRQPALAKKLRSMTQFPDAQHVIEYAFPVVSSRVQAIRPVRSRINVPQLTRLCERYFRFSISPISILNKFTSVASSAFVMDGLLGQYYNDRSSSQAVIVPRLASKRPGVCEEEISEFRCAIPTEPVLSAICTSFSGSRKDEGRARPPKKEAKRSLLEFRAWVPQTILFKVAPDAVEKFGSRKKRSKRRVRKGATAQSAYATKIHGVKEKVIEIEDSDMEDVWVTDENGAIILFD